MSTQEQIYFFELLRASVGNLDCLSGTPTAEEWEQLYDTAKKQALVGVCFFGIKRLPQEQQPPLLRRRQWAVKAMRLEERNAQMSEATRMVSGVFQKAGFDCVILKGQGNIANYDEGMGIFRVPGDVDVWVRPKDNEKPRVRSVIEYCESVKKGEYVYYHNLDFPILKDIEVEVHYRPTWLFCPWRDRILQKWMNKRFEGKEYDGYKIPSMEFNTVFQLLHIYKHLFEEGIGLRQLMDYYFVLKSGKCKNVYPLLCKLGLKRFTGAVMYVMQEVFGMSDEYLLCRSKEKEGRELLSEIMIAGNFGHHDHRYNFAEATNGSMQYRGKEYAWLRLRRNFRFVKNYPMEVLWEPSFRVFHWVWRTFRLWRW